MSFKGTEIYRDRAKNTDAIPMPMPLYRQDITALCNHIDELERKYSEACKANSRILDSNEEMKEAIEELFSLLTAARTALYPKQEGDV